MKFTLIFNILLGRNIRFLICLILMGAFFSDSALQAQEQSSDSDSVKFAVSSYSTLQEVRVVDAVSNPVKGLRQDDFLVKEEGRRRPVLYFEETNSAPVSLGILVDVGSNMSETSILTAKQATFDLIHLLEPTDEILLAVYDREVHPLSELTSDRYELLEAIRNISPGARPGFWSRFATAFGSSGYTGEAVDYALLELKKARHATKIILVFSAAFGNLGPATEEHLEMAGARFFAVRTSNKLGDAFNLWGDSVAAKKILDSTGGMAFSAQEILERLNPLRDAMKTYYLLAYQPADIEKSLEKREVSIEIAGHPDYRVHAARRVVFSDSVLR